MERIRVGQALPELGKREAKRMQRSIFTGLAALFTGLAALLTGLAALVGVNHGSALAAEIPGTPIATFTISEQFGVSHPLQVIDFDFHRATDPARTYMIGPEGNQVPFQRLGNGNIAVQTDLPAGSRRSWKLFAGVPPRALPHEVRVTTGSQFIEVTNGVTGVRIARLDGAHSNLAPIQGVRLASGEWSATGPNYLSVPGNSVRPPLLQARTAETRLIEAGPLRATIEVRYTYNRPALINGNKVAVPAGEGHYLSTITLDAGSPSVMIEDDSDTDLQYSLNFYKDVEPDRGRYRGHHATSAEFGHEQDGRMYRTYDVRPGLDAEREFGYRVPIWSSYITGNYGGYSLLERLGLWNPWIFDSGWYWMMYKQSAPPEAPLVGIFPGRASRLIGAGDSGPGFMFVPGQPASNRVAAICMQINRREPNGVVFPRVRAPWAIFIGTKGKDLGDPGATQNIARQTNLHSAINLNKVYRYQLTYPDPPQGVQPLYMPKDTLLRIANRARSSQQYYKYLFNAEPGARPIYDMWRDPTGGKVNAAAMHVFDLAKAWLDAEVNGNGMHDTRFAYWHGGLVADTAAPVINELLSIEPIAPAMRERIKAVTALFGYLLWDNDLAPLDGDAGVNLGTPNMPVQQYQYRHLYAVMLSRNPAMTERANQSAAEIAKSFANEINSAGAQRASPHYADASMEPLLDAAQQLRIAGVADLFETVPLLAKFGDFYMQMLTPREARFGLTRKLVSIGDGATEASPLFGELGTYMASANPALSAELMAAWKSSGAAHSGFHGSTVLKIDEDLPASEVKLRSSQWPGWCSVMRSAVNLPDESALWFLNGDFYSDHAHYDKGSVTFYALGAPVSIDWGSIYNPHAMGPYVHSLVMPETTIPGPWAGDARIDDSPLPWLHSTQDGFSTFDDATWSAATFEAANGSKWFRTVALVHPDDRQPVIMITDALAGPYGVLPRVASLNMMARGVVQTPAGPITPPVRLDDVTHKHPVLPAGGTPAAMLAGLNRFHFEGQWGVDWDLYTLAPMPQEYIVGSWGHSWFPSAEMAEFQRVNKRPFEESQYILRIKGTGALKTFIVPTRQGSLAPTVTRLGDRFEYRTGPNSEGVIGDTFQAWRSVSETVLTAFDRPTAAAYGMSISGGPAEVRLKYNHAFLTVTGPKGRREFHIGGDWETKAPASQISPGVVAVDFDGGDTLHLVLAPRGANR